MMNLKSLLAAILIGIVAGSAGYAADERLFLEALRSRGYFDLATEYIEELNKSSGLSAEAKASLPYEEGLNLIEQSRQERDTAVRMNLLNRSREKLEPFVQSNPQHPLRANAGLQLGTVLAERGQTALARARQPGTTPVERDLALREARQFFQQGEKIYADSEKSFIAALSALPREFQKEDIRSQRQDLRDMLLRTQLFAVELMFQHARTFEHGAAESKKILTAALGKSQNISAENQNNLGGFMARKLEGQCYQALGDLKRATGAYDELSGLPADEPSYSALRTEALLLTLQCMTDNSQKRFVEAVERGKLWLKDSRPAEREASEGLAIQYYIALALQRNAESLKREDEGRKKEQLAEARRIATVVARTPGSFQDDAKALVKAVSGKDLADQEPTTFSAAFERGKSAYEGMAAAQLALSGAPASDPNIPKLRQDLQMARIEAIREIQRAMELRDEKVQIEEVNNARLVLSHLYYLTGDYYDATILGEFIGRKYPESESAKMATTIALSSIIRSFDSTPPDARDFERESLLRIAKLITETQPPGQKESDDAWTVLMQLAIAENDTSRVIECLNRIPANSPRRGAANLQAGQAMMNAYTREALKPESEQMPAAKLAELQRLARETIEQGLNQQEELIAGGAEITNSLVGAQLRLAEIYLAGGQADAAVKVLTAPKIGAVTLADAKHPATTVSNQSDIYRVALRAFVNAGDLDKAEASMNKLEASFGADEKSAALLTRVYVSLGRELQEQLIILRNGKKTAELKKLSDSFDRFIDRVDARQKGQTYNSMVWVANTFFNLAEGYDDPLKSAADPQAKAYYQKAIAAYGKILAASKTDPNFLPAGGRRAVLLRMANCYRRSGSPDKAIQMLVEVLKENVYNLDAQKQAALTFQEWGRTDHLQYKNAIAGAEPFKSPAEKRESKLIFGWNKLANLLQPKPTLNDDFHEARYNQALCLFEFALQAKLPKDRTQAFEDAERTIKTTALLHSKLGGPEMKKKYETLLDRIQTAAGKPKTGLPVPELAPPPAPQAAAASAGSAAR